MKTNLLIRGICLIAVVLSISGCKEEYDKVIDKTIYANKSSLALYYGDKEQVTVSPVEEGYSWISDNTEVATVSADGLIEAVGVGITDVIVSKNGLSKYIPVTVSIPTFDRVIGRPGNKRVALELVITNDKIKTVKITRLDNNESQTQEVNYQSGTIIIYYNNLEEGNYPFKVVCIDRFDNESTPFELSVRAYGDAYQSTLVNRQINVVSKFGNGMAATWTNNVGNFIEFFYTDENGQPASKVVPVNAQSSHVVDFDSGPVSYKTLYLPEPASVDTFRLAQVSYTGTINDYTTYIRSSPAVTIVKPGDFDLGGEGVGFHDSDSNHSGAAGANYRKDRGDTRSDPCDIEAVAGNIGTINTGEWMIYTLIVLDEGDYEIDWYISVNNSAGSTCHVEIDGVSSAVYQMPNQSNWSAWRYHCEANGATPPEFHLTPGKHKLLFYANSSGFNFNGMKVTYKP
ncbi:MAG: hypothetical protein LBT50_03580 [Prevotellaceae bacterium]|jgi:hypothetical protein|nr:hypothetical protein [Prevotellaceae bacterium]